MATEIERKFLVANDQWRHDLAIDNPPVFMAQGYLNSGGPNTVRIRVAEPRAFLTIKGPTIGIQRQEFEYPVPLEDGRQLLDLCGNQRVEKNRFVIPWEDGLKWEVDEFLGDNVGLVVAEIELREESQRFRLPAWLGEEVTHDRRYANSSLARCPYNQW